MKHQDYIDTIMPKCDFDGIYYILWLDKTFYKVLPGKYSDVLAVLIHPEFKERVQVLLSTADDSGQTFEDISILPYSIQKQLINYINN